MANTAQAAQLIEELVEALEALRRSTKVVEKTARRALGELQSGADVATALAAALPADTRATMNDSLKRVEDARHQIRLMVFADGMKQGMSIGELARQYGFSRQLAARYAKEAQDRR